MTKRKIEYWVIPPDADGEFVANMEEVLETYEKAYDPDCPVVCMDEQPVQLIGETRVPIPATKEHPERVDYEYERKGTASIFMFAEPLSGFRQATARPHRTKDGYLGLLPYTTINGSSFPRPVAAAPELAEPAAARAVAPGRRDRGTFASSTARAPESDECARPWLQPARGRRS